MNGMNTKTTWKCSGMTDHNFFHFIVNVSSIPVALLCVNVFDFIVFESKVTPRSPETHINHLKLPKIIRKWTQQIDECSFFSSFSQLNGKMKNANHSSNWERKTQTTGCKPNNFNFFFFFWPKFSSKWKKVLQRQIHSSHSSTLFNWITDSIEIYCSLIEFPS